MWIDHSWINSFNIARNEVDYIVIEYGVAKLKVKSIGTRVKELINIVHPKFREELTMDAKKMNLI